MRRGSFLSIVSIAAALLASSCGKRGAQTPVAGDAVHHVHVDAQRPLTLVGRYAKGTVIAITPRGGTWSNDATTPPIGPEGRAGSNCLDDGAHHCIGGDNQAPAMTLVALMSHCPMEEEGCFAFGRDPIPYPMKLTAPDDGWLYLAPNDFREALGDDVGAIEVDVVP